MSKKVSLPVMSLSITGVLYILGLILVTMKRFFTPVVLATQSLATQNLVNDFLGFLSAFLIIWALTSIVLHPDIEDDNLKWVFIFFSIIIAISVFTALFGFVATIT
jgi:hypothetical protein